MDAGVARVDLGETVDLVRVAATNHLDPDRRASLELRASFSDLDATPQAYFSQSHLDTLGLCVFQALVPLHSDFDCLNLARIQCGQGVSIDHDGDSSGDTRLS